jgi:hypothetical protein
MAINKKEVLYDKFNRKRTTTIDYWAYRPTKQAAPGEGGFADGIITYDTPRDLKGHPIPQRAVKVTVDGYLNKAARSAAKTNGTFGDHTHEFLIVNWVEEKQTMREMTNAEKREVYTKGKAEIDREAVAGISYEGLFELYTDGMTPEEKEEAKNLNFKDMYSKYLLARDEYHASISDTELNSLKWPEVVEKVDYIPHNDFDEFIKVMGTDEETAVAYRLLKGNPAHRNFFDGSEDA